MDRRFALALALIPACLCAQREGVLKQVDLPHAYYWREMYVPQVTSGPSSATWSPDGTELIYSMQGRLWRSRIGSPAATQLTSGPSYDYQPDWSPDGRTIVFARYAHDAIELQLLDLTSGSVTPLTSNGAVNLEPRWSPDGSRIAFVSSLYHGRWHVFILSPAGAKDLLFSEPVRLTDDNDSQLPRYYYSKWDHYIAPRWSPDGSRIAFVSNESGNTSLWVIDVPGGRKQPIAARERHYRGPVGTLRIDVVDRGGRSLSARMSVTSAEGRGYAPDDAWRHADEAFDRSERQFEYSYFHSAGAAELTVPAGRVHVEVWHGPEYQVFHADVNVPTGIPTTRRIVLNRLDNLPAHGWWSGDVHVHMNYGGAYRNTPPHLAFQARAEDLHVVENLIVNKEQRIPDIAYFRTDADPVSTPTFLLRHAQEFHTSVWGHLGLLGLGSHYLLPEYAGYPNTAASSLALTNATVADLGHAQGALVGYVHPFDTKPDPADTTAPLFYELPVDGPRGKVDYLEVMGYSEHLITSEIWYRLLNCGFRLPAAAGTDAFPNFASLRGPPGLVRVFVHSGDRKSTRLNSSHLVISYAVFCLKKKKKKNYRYEKMHNMSNQRRAKR